jgi:transcription elongation factor GreA
VNTEQVYITSAGLDDLKVEYEDLIKNKRKEVARRIAVARELSADSDDVNPEYEAAREEQSFVEGRILELEEILKRATIIGAPKNGNRIVDVGSSVVVELGGGQETYTIVGTVEAAPEKGKISHESPVGKALMGLKVGDEVTVSTPDTTLKYRIKKIY